MAGIRLSKGITPAQDLYKPLKIAAFSVLVGLFGFVWVVGFFFFPRHGIEVFGYVKF